MKRSILLLGACFAFVAGACGGADVADDVASLAVQSEPLELAQAEPVDTEEALLAFTACMRENGVEMPDPEVDSEGNVSLGFRQAAQTGGLSRQALQAGFEACGDLIEGVAQQFARPDLTEVEDQLLAFAQCMRDQGVDMDDPDLNAAPGGGGPFGGIDREDPDFQAAAGECEDFLPNVGVGGRGGAGAAEVGDNG